MCDLGWLELTVITRQFGSLFKQAYRKVGKQAIKQVKLSSSWIRAWPSSALACSSFLDIFVFVFSLHLCVGASIFPSLFSAIIFCQLFPIGNCSG